MSKAKAITFYGASWCGDCHRAKSVLDEHKVDYKYIDIESDSKASATVEKLNHGLRSIPTIVFSDESILVEPANHVLEAKLMEMKLI